MHESEKGKGSRSVVSDSSRPHGLQPTRLLRPWIFQAKVLEWGAIAFSSRENGYMYIYDWVPLLFPWNHCHIVNRLYPNIKLKVKKKKKGTAAEASKLTASLIFSSIRFTTLLLIWTDPQGNYKYHYILFIFISWPIWQLVGNDCITDSVWKNQRIHSHKNWLELYPATSPCSTFLRRENLRPRGGCHLSWPHCG